MLVGKVLATLVPPRAPKGSRIEKVVNKIGSWVLRGFPPGTSSGAQIGNTSGKSCSEKHVKKHSVQTAAQEVSGDSLQPSR